MTLRQIPSVLFFSRQRAEVVSAAALAGVFTVPLGMSLSGKTGSLLAFTIAAMLFLPKFIRKGMSTDADTMIVLFGKNVQVKKVFWSIFIVLAGFVLAQVVDPETPQEIIRIFAGTIVSKNSSLFYVSEKEKHIPAGRVTADRRR